MPIFPVLKDSYPTITQQVVDVFRGYNHNLKIDDGEFFEMKNLSSSYFPLLANRDERGIVADLSMPSGLLAKSKLAYIDGNKLFYDFTDITSYLTAAGCAISTDENMLPKTMISMGAYILIFPDKLYINTENLSDCGTIEKTFATAENAAVTYSICRVDGTGYESAPTVSSTAPGEPSNGDLWIDTSGEIHSLKQFSSNSNIWTEIPTVYTKISYTGIGAAFNKLDGVKINGCASDVPALVSQIEALNGSKIIYDKADDYIVVIGLLDLTYTQESGSVSISRAMPEMDFITEAGNRLWGCKYGFVNGKTVNEIYCCALGDFKNWNQFLGLSTDSYAASVGTDGAWTGAVTHLGFPLFFKENCMHKVYINSSGAHQIVDTACRGVQSGSHKSLVVVNERLYYKSLADVCVYDGSLPVSISAQLGPMRYFDAVAGSIGDKYYISMRDGAGEWHLFAYDTFKGFWHREDNTRASCFAQCDGELFYIDKNTNKLMCVNGSMGTKEGQVSWSATSGLVGYDYVEQKYISRFNLRMKLPVGSMSDMYIEYDSDGVWKHVGHMEGVGTNTFMLPVIARRCDHFRLRLEGMGEIRIYSFSKIYEAGSDG